MNIIKKHFKSIGITLLLIVIFSFFISIFNYFDVLSTSLYKILILIFLVLSVSIGSYILGYNSENKGYLNGLIFGLILSIVFIILNLIFKHNISSSSIIYYLIIVITSLISSTIGINKKTTEKQ